MAAELTVERTGTRAGIARNGRGAALEFAPVEVDGAFTPGELLALALAACNLMSADHAIARRVGEDAAVTGRVTPTKDAADNRYSSAEVTLVVPEASGLDAQAQAELDAVVARAVARGCTVGRTLEHGMPHTLAVVDH